MIRKIPETFGLAQHQDVYAAVAQRVYVPSLAPDFAYVHWRDEYELPAVENAYDHAHRLTGGFTNVDVVTLEHTLKAQPETLRIFRLILGFTPQEFAAATQASATRMGVRILGVGRVKGMEAGRLTTAGAAKICAETIRDAMAGKLFPPGSGAVVSKLAKPDTRQGWDSVRKFARDGVPLAVYLHQRHYGGAFRQLLDATSGKRGDIIEDAVEALFRDNGIPFLRTGSDNQEEIVRRFGLTVRPAPDFVVYDPVASDTLRALLECKGANDGGTARDKAARFQALRGEAARLGGIPLFAVLAGLGWKRTADALGPVVRHTDGRVFTIPTLASMVTAEPFPALVGSASAPDDSPDDDD